MTRLTPAALARLRTEGRTVQPGLDSERLTPKVEVAAVRPITLRFCVPLPPRILHPNARPDWHAKARAARAYRETVYICAFAAFEGQQRPRFERAVMDLEYVFATARRRDQDGLWIWFKNGQDALVDAGIIPDDDAEHLTLRSVTARKAGRIGGVLQQPGVQVWLEEVR